MLIIKYSLKNFLTLSPFNVGVPTNVISSTPTRVLSTPFSKYVHQFGINTLIYTS